MTTSASSTIDFSGAKFLDLPLPYFTLKKLFEDYYLEIVKLDPMNFVKASIKF